MPGRGILGGQTRRNGRSTGSRRRPSVASAAAALVGPESLVRSNLGVRLVNRTQHEEPFEPLESDHR